MLRVAWRATTQRICQPPSTITSALTHYNNSLWSTQQSFDSLTIPTRTMATTVLPPAVAEKTSGIEKSVW